MDLTANLLTSPTSCTCLHDGQHLQLSMDDLASLLTLPDHAVTLTRACSRLHDRLHRQCSKDALAYLLSLLSLAVASMTIGLYNLRWRSLLI